MQTTNDIYRRLAKRFHPDTVLASPEKAILDRLMVEINAARERDDIDALLEIENLGPAYLAMRQFSEASVSGFEADYAEPPPPFGHRSSSWNTMLDAIRPYALWNLLGEWEDHGPLRKLATLFCAVGWTFLAWLCWGALSNVSSMAIAHGYPHESIPGLIIVLLRGLLIMASLRLILPLLVVSLIVAVFCGTAYVCTLLLAGVLGYFHPMLRMAAYAIVGAYSLFSAWVALNRR